ncbi:MAG: glycosyltransferase family 4 protein [Anaerolineales bacterium]|nr:glycosyltransferase family 4 protein [Anaerolineales bacterium]
MKLLYLTNGYPPRHTAGTESYTAALAQAWAQAGHTVRVVCAGDWEAGARPYNGRARAGQAGVQVDRLNLNWTAGRDPNSALFDNPATAAVVAETLAEFQPDLVHLTSAYTLSASVLRPVTRRGVPLVVTLTDFWFICPQVTLRRSDGRLCDGRTTADECLRCMLGSSHFYQRARRLLPEAALTPLLRWASRHPGAARRRGLRGYALDMARRKATLLPLLEQAAAVVAPSHTLADLYSANGLRQAVRVIPYGHDIGWAAQAQPRPADGRVVFGYAGRLTEAKGVHVLVEAAARLDAQLPIEVQLYGDPAAEPDYVARLKAVAGSDPRVRFMGHFAREALAQVYSQIDALVVPSVWYENNPLVIQEAYAAGRPVIASELGGMAEFVQPGVSGLLFAAGEAAALAETLTDVARDPALLARLRAGVPPVRTMAQELDEIGAVYAEALATRRVAAHA